MKYLLTAFVLLASAGWAQQSGQSTPGSPPYTTPPTFPQDRRAPSQQQIPPDQQAPPRAMSTAEVQQQIQQHLDSEPLLHSADIRARAEEDSVSLTGTVDNESQHELALRIAQSYAGERKIIDKIKVRG